MRLAWISPALITGAASAATVSADQAHLDYQLYCQGCHTPDGSGHMGVPALKNQLGVFLQVPGGRNYLVQVPGSANSALDDSRLAAVLNYILLRFGQDTLPQTFTPYSAEEVAVLRRQPLNQIARVRRQLLARRPAADRSGMQRQP